MKDRISYAAARWWPFGAALLVIAVAAGVAVANQRDEKLRAAVGDVVQTSVDRTALDNSEIRIPTGAVQVGATAPVTEVAELRGRQAPEDGSWVGVTVEDTVNQRLPQPSAATRDVRPEPPVAVELIVGGRTYAVPPDAVHPPSRFATAPGREAWVAVAGRSKDVRIAITYDGVKQSVRPSDGKRTAGRAAPLYDLAFAQTSITEAPSCGSLRYPTAYTEVSDGFAPICDARQYPLLPYLPQFGWAPSGSKWLAFEIRNERYVSVRWRPDGGAGVAYNIDQTPALQVRLDGTSAVMNRATAPSLRATVGYDPTYLAVFAVPATAGQHRLTVAMQWRDLDTGSGPPPAGAPVSPDIALTWTKEVR